MTSRARRANYVVARALEKAPGTRCRMGGSMPPVIGYVASHEQFAPSELDEFAVPGLELAHLDEIVEPGDPPVPRFIAEFAAHS